MAVVAAYYGITVTLADTTAHQLLPLLVAIDASLAGLSQNVQVLAMQADGTNAGNSVYVGDAAVASTRKGDELLLKERKVFSKEACVIPLGAIWVRASAATCKLNVEIIP